MLSAAIEGMFLNSELFDHQRGASNKGYKKIDMGTLVLSTQNLHLGNANVNLRFEHGMVSPAYTYYGTMTREQVLANIGEAFLKEAALSEKINAWLMEQVAFTYEDGTPIVSNTDKNE